MDTYVILYSLVHFFLRKKKKKRASSSGYDEETENYLAISGDKNPRKRRETVLKPNKIEYY